MELIICWILTIIVSLVMNLENDFKIFKDVADEGYKVDINKLNELSSLTIEGTRNRNVFIMFIPVFNMLKAMNDSMILIKNRNETITSFDIAGAIMEMTQEEKKRYAKNPTGINAFKIAVRNNVKKEKPLIITTMELEDGSVIDYTFSNDEIKIIDAKGLAAELSTDELEDIIIRKQIHSVLGDAPKDENIDDTQKRKDQLLEMKNELLSFKEEKKEDKPKVYEKRK